MIKCRIGVTDITLCILTHEYIRAEDAVQALAEFLELDEMDLKRKFDDFGSKTFATEADVLIYKMSKPEYVIVEIVEDGE